jgi:mono/diheme cytochrome c family protein
MGQLAEVGSPILLSKEREVPGFVGGTAMMYIESDADLREWILDGKPRRLAGPLAGEAALLKMPAYRDRLHERELDALVAWYRAVAAWNPDMPEVAARGRRVAARSGCFGCHGDGGVAGVPNPGSLKGYVPGWGSPDYSELVADEAELRAWILDGRPARFAESRLAGFFLDRQVLRMPAYRDVIEPAALNDLVEYVQWAAGTVTR